MGSCYLDLTLPGPQASMKELMARALDLESQRWAQDVAPQRLNGHCHSELAIDIIQVAAPPPVYTDSPPSPSLCAHMCRL